MKDPIARTTSRAAPRGALLVNLVEFCRILRSQSLRVHAGSAEIAARAVAEIDITERAQFRAALRISLLQRPEDIPAFNDLFASYWYRGDDDEPRPADRSRRERPTHDGAAGQPDTVDDPPSAPPQQTAPADQQGDGADRSAGATEASREGIHGVTLAAATGSDSAELDRIGRALAQALARRRSRRRISSRRGRYLDTRKLLRNSLRHGGFPLELAWRQAKITRANLLILCDVSRSMEVHAHMLLRFASAVLRHAWRVEVFLFANRLVRITDYWLDSDWRDLTRVTDSLGGGTQIGASLEALMEDYGFASKTGERTAVILSDGLDAGEPAVLSRAMARMRRHMRQIIWLNPLLTTAGYEPTARGMAAALPYVDVFAGADGEAALWNLIRVLREAA